VCSGQWFAQRVDPAAAAPLSGVSPLTSPTFHHATSLLVEGFIVFDQTRGTNDEIRLNRLLMMNGFINQLLTIDEGPGWTGRLVVGVVEGPDPQQGSSALPGEVVAD